MTVLPSTLYFALHDQKRIGIAVEWKEGDLHGRRSSALHVDDVDICLDLDARLRGDRRAADGLTVELVDEGRVQADLDCRLESTGGGGSRRRGGNRRPDSST